MPVVEIRALPQPDGVDPAAACVAVARALAAFLGEDERGTWATWEEIGAGLYAEGGDAPAQQPQATHPPLVRVTAFEGRAPAVVAGMLKTVAETLARALGVEDGNVFVRYEEQVSGRLHTGGRVR